MKITARLATFTRQYWKLNLEDKCCDEGWNYLIHRTQGEHKESQLLEKYCPFCGKQIKYEIQDGNDC